MSAARYRPLSPAALIGVDDPCEHCGYGFGGRPTTDPLGRPEQRRPGWLDDVADLWGACGVAAHVGSTTPGYLTFAPADLVTGMVLPFDRSGDVFSPDAAVVVQLAVCREFRGRGIARNLVRTAAAQLTKRQVGIIEVVGVFGPALNSRSGLRPEHNGDADRTTFSLLPVGFWLSVGFRIVRPHPVAPTLRLDVASTVRRRPDFTAAWQRIADLVKAPGPAQPASFQQRSCSPPDSRPLSPAA